MSVSSLTGISMPQPHRKDEEDEETMSIIF